MARGTGISDRVQALIADVHSNHPYYGATKIQREVLKRLHDKKDQFYDKNAEPHWPGVSAVGKKLKIIIEIEKKKPPELKELDKPFILGALVKHPISPEALPVVLRVWAEYRREGGTFTIREALWVARLSVVLLEFEKVGDKNRCLGNLIPWYDIRERAYEAVEKDIDTTDLDIEVLKLLKLEERKEEEEDKTPLSWDYEKGYLKDAKGRIRGRIRVLHEDPYEPKGKKKKGGQP